MPYPFASTGVPPVATPTAHPGVDEVHVANTASTFDPTFELWPPSATGRTPKATVMVNARLKPRVTVPRTPVLRSVSEP